MTLEAVYTHISQLTPGDAAGTVFTLTYFPTGGVMPHGVSLTHTLPINTAITTLPSPTRSGYIFTGWMMGNLLAELPILVTGNISLTASWLRESQPNSANAGQAAHANTPAPTPAPTPSPAPATFAAVFNPSPGMFAGTETGLRVGVYNSNIYNIPVPVRSGYIFGGWQLPDGGMLHGSLNLRGDILLTPVWNVDAAATPAPTPSPAPNIAPAPNPTSGQSTDPTNPQTGPMRVSFMLFFVVMAAGVSAYGITKISRRHMAAAGEYRSRIARYNREKRVADLLGE